MRAKPVVAATATPDGRGYWLVTSTGQVMAFGDAKSYGSITSPITGHVVGHRGHRRRHGILDR